MLTGREIEQCHSYHAILGTQTQKEKNHCMGNNEVSVLRKNATKVRTTTKIIQS